MSTNEPVFEGTVDWFNDAKGYGFIQPDHETMKYFVHHSEIVATGFRSLSSGERVQFGLTRKGEGFVACRVRSVAPSEMSPPRYVFFVAHAAQDLATARRLVKYLRAGTRGECFLAADSIIPGTPWDTAIQDALESTQYVVVLVSPHTSTAFYQREELHLAIRRARRPKATLTVIPVYLGSPLTVERPPYGLSSLQSIYLRRGQSVRALARWLCSIADAKTRLSSEESLTQMLESGSARQRLRRALLDSKRPFAGPMVGALRDLEKYCSARRGSRSIVFADVNGFNGLNQAHGTAVGDAVLRTIDALSARSFETGLVARFGADEYIVALRGVGADSALEQGRAFRDAVRRYRWSRLSPHLFVRVAVGVAHGGPRSKVTDLVVDAVLATREAKRTGRVTLAVPALLKALDEVRIKLGS